MREMVQSEIGAIKVLAKGMVEITQVYFSSYKDPTDLNIEVKNRDKVAREVKINIYADGSLAHTVSDTIEAESMKTITVSVADLNLSRGEHFIYCELAEE